MPFSNPRRTYLIIFLFIIMNVLTAGVITASEDDPVINADLIQIDSNQIDSYDIPPTIGGYTILPGGILDDVPDDFAPTPDACATAAGSYVSEGMDAIRSTMISFDQIVHENKDPELVLYALYAMEANEFAELDVLFDNPQNMDVVSPFVDGDAVTIGNNSSCLTEGPLTARLWQLENGLWAIESIQFNEPYDISDAWSVNPDPQLGNVQFDMPVLVEGIVVRYMMPYIEPPVTTVPGANADQIAPADDQLFACEGTAPSYINVGADIFLNGYGYAQFPLNIADHWTDWQFDNTSVALGDYGMQVYMDVLNETPLIGIPGNLESIMLSPEELYSGINFGTVVDGPVCKSMNAEPAFNPDGGVTEAPDPDHDRFYTWWQIKINGEVGWYPEVVSQYSHWLWDHEGMFNRKLNLYYLTPANAMQAQANDCPPSNLYAGIDVQPASGAMNLRQSPNGAVIGRVETDQVMTIFGEPTCTGGTIWWQTDLGGYVAETNPGTRIALLLPAIQQAPEADMTEDTGIEEVIVTVVPADPQPQETPVPEPEHDDDDDNKNDHKKTNNKSRGESSREDNSNCDPTTGRGC